MTVIGKILTLLNFFASLIFLGFAVSVNQTNKDPQTRKTWVTVVGDLRKENQKLRTDNDESTKARNQERSEAQAQRLRDQEEKELEKKRADAAVKGDAASKAEAADSKKKFEDSQVVAIGLTTQLELRRKGEEEARRLVKERDLTIADQSKEITLLRTDKIQLKTAADSYQARLQELEAEYRRIVRELEKERERIATGTTANGATTPSRPPPDDVQGKVVEVTPEGFVSITIGSDHGLLKGHTLHVFRTEPKPLYLGELVIIEAGPKDAVGKLKKMDSRKLVQPNDIVASRIVPGR